MALHILTSIKNGNVVTTRYACPCGKGYIEEEQDYTPGFRDGIAFIFCPECEKNTTLIMEIVKYIGRLDQLATSKLIVL